MHELLTFRGGIIGVSGGLRHGSVRGGGLEEDLRVGVPNSGCAQSGVLSGCGCQASDVEAWQQGGRMIGAY